jgi:hypothetical protein
MHLNRVVVMTWAVVLATIGLIVIVGLGDILVQIVEEGAQMTIGALNVSGEGLISMSCGGR